MGPTSVACGLVASLSPTAVRFGLFGTGYSQNSSTSSVVLVLLYMYSVLRTLSLVLSVSRWVGVRYRSCQVGQLMGRLSLSRFGAKNGATRR